MEFEVDKIAGYYVGGADLFCMECVNSEKIEIEDSDDLLLYDEVEKEESIFFCDNCGKRIE
jgi:hypothetical protein